MLGFASLSSSYIWQIQCHITFCCLDEWWLMNKRFEREEVRLSLSLFFYYVLCPRKVTGKFPSVALQQLQSQGTSICHTPLKAIAFKAWRFTGFEICICKHIFSSNPGSFWLSCCWRSRSNEINEWRIKYCLAGLLLAGRGWAGAGTPVAAPVPGPGHTHNLHKSSSNVTLMLTIFYCLRLVVPASIIILLFRISPPEIGTQSFKQPWRFCQQMSQLHVKRPGL